MDALSVLEETDEDLPKWLQEEPDEEERIFCFSLPASFPRDAFIPSKAGATAQQQLSVSQDQIECRVMAVGRHLQHIRGAIGMSFLSLVLSVSLLPSLMR